MNHNHTPRCPICSSLTEKKLIETFNDYKIFQCPDCGVEFAHPFMNPDPEFYIGGDIISEPAHLSDLIKSSQYITNYGIHSYLMSLVYAFHKVPLELYWPQRKFLTDYLPPGSKLLDIGCGTCVFLRYAKKVRCDTWGIDISPNFIKACRYQGFDKTFAITLHEFSMRFPEHSFDVVTMFEVLEHLDNPVATLKTVKRILREGGILAVSVPNNERGRLKLGLKPTEEDYPPHHLTRWTPAAIAGFIKRMGFDIIVHLIAPINIGYSISRRLYDPITPSRVFNRIEKWKGTNKVTHDLTRIQRYTFTKHTIFSNILSPFGIVLNLLGLKGKNQLIVAKPVQ